MTEKRLVPNSTQTPNIIYDFLVPPLPEGEAKCLLYICRRTYGFHKEKDRISLSQFINGIKKKKGEEIDSGAGPSRPVIVEALKNLREAGLILVEENTKGYSYQLNLELFSGKDWREAVDKVVKKVNQLRKLTKSGKESKPKSVKFPNLQNKGNKGNKDYRQLKKLKEMKNEILKGKWGFSPRLRTEMEEEVAKQERRLKPY